jgi:uncharacterized protein YndB with AHSA1/START domain
MDRSNLSHSPQGLPGKPEVRHSTLIYADPLRVYHALATSEGLDAWFTNGASVKDYPG